MPIPWALELGYKCRNFGALPRAGGILDNDEFIISAIEHCMATKRIWETDIKDRTNNDRLFMKRVLSNG